MGPMARTTDYYALLGVERTADLETIKRAFRAHARALHPDVSDAPAAAERFQELERAYRVLSAPNARLLYDHVGYLGPGNGGFDGGVSARVPPRLDELTVVRYGAAAALAVAVAFLVFLLFFS
jgi:curved DNA-binding protein CbpA